MTVRRTIIAIIALVVVGPFTAQAQPASLTDEARQLSLEVFDLENDQGFLDEVIVTAHDQWDKMVDDAGDRMPPDSKRLFDRIYLPKLRAGLADLKREMAEVYETNYSIEEMRGIIAFDRSPLGRRISELRPIIDRQSFAKQSAWMQAALAEMIQETPETHK